MGTNNEVLVWTYLKKQGFTDAGVAGCMGNFYAESTIRFDAIEKAKLNKIGMTAQQYITAVDNGTRPRSVFISDRVGVSLYQATASNLKADLYDLAKSRGVSICDPDTVLDSFINALKNYAPAVLKTLQSTTDLFTASNTVLLKFERPADQSANAQNRRYQYSKTFYDKYAGTQIEEPAPEPPAPPVDTETLTYDEFVAYMNNYRDELAKEETSDWAKEDVEWAVNEGLLKGDGDSLFPRDFITREQMCALIHRLTEGR